MLDKILNHHNPLFNNKNKAKLHPRLGIQKLKIKVREKD
jgi:hypothetical protein